MSWDEAAIGKVADIVNEHSATGQCTFEVIPAKEGANPYPLTVARTMNGGGSVTLNVEERTDWLDHPTRKSASVAMAHVGSFVDYIERHKTPGTEIFLSKAGRDSEHICFLAHIDGDGILCAGWKKHQATLTPGFSREFTKWQNIGKVTLTQRALADFLEDLSPTIIDPPAAMIKDLVLNLSSSTKVEWKSAVDLDNGDIQFQLLQDSKLKNVELPNLIKIAVNVFDGDERVPFDVRLRYKISTEDGSVEFRLIPLLLDDAKDRAVDRLVEQIESQTEIKVFR